MFLRSLFNFTMPEFDWIQVEVSSKCNSSCIYCPRTVYKKTWQNRNMTLDTYRKILPYFKKTKLIHLQGWGEPLLNADFFTMVYLAKKSGCIVSTTSNGMLVDQEKAEEIVSSGIDILTLSLAGSDEKNSSIRRGTELDKVIKVIDNIQKIKEEKGSSTPAIHIAYMLLRSGIADLNRLPDILTGYNIGQVVISTLDFCPSPELEGEVIFPGDECEQSIHLLLKNISAPDIRERIFIHLNKGESPQKTCPENIQRSVFISADGQVSPCAFTNIPTSDTVFVSSGKNKACHRVTFGNINEYPLKDIWKKKEYILFREQFSSGNVSERCSGCYKLR